MMTASCDTGLFFRGSRHALARHAPRLFAAATLAILATGMGVTACAAAETIEIYAAGSLRTTVEQLAKEAGPILDIEVKPTFFSSGALRQRIEKGESPDLFLSADMGSPRKLADAGRTVVPAIAFARNSMCLVTKKSDGVTQDNLVDRMLGKDVRIRTSAPIDDPAGDYAVEIFDRIDVTHPGAGKILRDKTQSLRESLSATPRAPSAALFKNNQIDMAISYCSGTAAMEKEMPDLATIAFPPDLEPHPVDGMAVLSNKPAAMRLALFLLSGKGQAIVKNAGLLPLVDPVQ